MSNLLVESSSELKGALVDEIGQALPPTDPQLTSLVEQVQEQSTVTSTPSTFFVAHDGDAFTGYGRTRQRTPNGDDWMFDVILAPGPSDRVNETAKAVLNAARGELDMKSIEWWTRGVATQVAKAIASDISFRHDRTVLRMEMELEAPAANHPVPTRGFALDDADEIVRVNNDAFRDHADRANITVSRLMNDFDSGEHDYSDLRVFEDQHGKVAGFVWTKEQYERYGELYVLAIDSAHQGMGYGRALVEAGINYLIDTYGSKRALLYVEAGNEHAIKLYESCGFADVNQSLVSFVSA